VSDDLSNYLGGWFGENWGAPVCEPERHMPTPVGDECIDCGQPIKENDQGMLIPFAGYRTVLGSHHLDCFLRAICPDGLREQLDKEVANDID
jgi:hypothetical protein